MLGKLLKYEWRGYRFPMLIMLIILMGTTVLTCGLILTLKPDYDDVVTGFTVIGLTFAILLYYFGIIGCIIGSSVIIAVRFYKTCYTDQGYLTHTLPVSTKTVLNAKLLMAVLVYLATYVLIGVTIFIIIGVTINHVASFIPAGTYSDFWGELSAIIDEAFTETFGISFGAYMAYMVVIVLISGISGVLTILGCVSLGQLYAKHRIIGAILAYFIVMMIEKTAGYISIIPTFSKLADAARYDRAMTFGSLYAPSIICSLIISIIVAVAMYFINLHMMTKKLNLE